jgi:hypothetical protein
MAPVAENAASHLRSITSHLSSLSSQLKRTVTAELPRSKAIIARSVTLLRRTYDPGAGVTPPNNIPNQAVFAVFGLIGAGLVITGIWFFFWAKNGGFYFKEGDWEDYKSTVLRRKGPNGTTLSGATRSTDLGGGSIVGERQRKSRYKDVDTEMSIGTESEMSRIKSESREKKSGRKGKKKKKCTGIHDGEVEESVVTGSVVNGDLEEERPDEAIRAYRHEKPARVGGLNRAPDGSAFEGSNVDSHSDLLSNRQRTPTSTPTKKVRRDNYTGGSGSPGIRKVESTSGKSSLWGSRSGTGTATDTQKSISETEDRIKVEARKLQEKGRAAAAAAAGGRRDFSYTVGDDASVTTVSRGEERRSRRSSRIPGSYAESSEGGSDVSGTKTYHHPMPELSSYAEEKRKARANGNGGGGGGYRRDRWDEISASELD